MGALLKKQKPMALSGSAWCPGGRTQQNAFAAPPDITLLRAKERDRNKDGVDHGH